MMMFGKDNLEQRLLAVIANTDPKVAYQKASESLEKGEYPTSLSVIVAELQAKDPDNFKKLSDKTLSRLNSDSLLGNTQAANLALGLLRPGPRTGATAAAAAHTSATSNLRANNTPILS